MIKDEFKYYLNNQAELLEKYNGKYIVIKDGSVISSYDDEVTAIESTQKEHELGTFLVQLVTPGSDDYSQTFHSRVAFQ